MYNSAVRQMDLLNNILKFQIISKDVYKTLIRVTSVMSHVYGTSNSFLIAEL